MKNFLILLLLLGLSGSANAGSTYNPGGGAAVSVTSGNNNIVITPTPGIGTFTVGTQNLIPTPTGRLTLTSATPVLSTNTTSNILYYAPYLGSTIPIYNGTSMDQYTFTSSATDQVGLSLTLDTNSAHTGYQQPGKLFDAFVWYNSGVPTLCTGPAWTNTTTRSNAVSQYKGIWTNTSSIVLKCDTTASTFTGAANQATLIGTVYVANATATTLNGGINSAVTAVTLTAAFFDKGLDYNYYILVDSEIMLVTAGFNTTSITVTRAALGTSAAAHSNGAAVSIAPGQVTWQPKPVKINLGSYVLLGIANLYNTVYATALEQDANGGWTYAGGGNVWEQSHNSLGNSIAYIDVVGSVYVDAMNTNYCYTSVSGNSASNGANIDVITAPPLQCSETASTATAALNAQFITCPNHFSPQGTGLHSLNSLESNINGSGTSTWVGNGNQALFFQGQL